MVRVVVFEAMILKIKGIIDSKKENNDVLQSVCELLINNIPEYDWVGFYFVDKAKGNELVLGPYAGQPTEHIRIKFGEGICGQAAERKETFIVEDVSKEENYLSCGVSVKSEIVVPLFRDGQIIGELDIDSDAEAAFGHYDEAFLKRVGELVKDLI